MRSAPPATPVADCTHHLALQPANSVEPKIEDALLGAILEGAVTSRPRAAAGPPPAPPVYCRERVEGVRWAMYRPDAATDRYFLALGDAGRAISVEPSAGSIIDPQAKPSISVTLLDLGGSVTFPPFDALPTPEQALADLARKPVAQATRGGRGNVNLQLAAPGAGSK